MRNRSVFLVVPVLLIVLSLSLVGCNRERPAPTPVVKAGTASPMPPGTTMTRVVLSGQTPQSAAAATPVPLVPGSPPPPTTAPVATSASAPGGEAAATTAQPGGESVYVVQRGDSLGKIATRYGVTVKQIVDLNGITNPNVITPGQKLKIPAAAPVAASTPGAEPSGSQKTYTVKAGDTLVAIATKYGVTVQAMQQLNNLASVDQIYSGQMLKIP